jgi:hypothetical protein
MNNVGEKVVDDAQQQYGEVESPGHARRPTPDPSTQQCPPDVDYLRVSRSHLVSSMT